MGELIHVHSKRITDDEGRIYIARVYAEQERAGTWIGWMEFHPTAPNEEILRTGTETTQPNRKAVVYWAGGLEPTYLEGAFERACRLAGRSA
jgi:hypothetical protein